MRRAVREAPRPYLVPPLPADLVSARAQGPQASLAFAMESARVAPAFDAGATDALGTLFIESLDALIRQALSPDETGDATFQAWVQRARYEQVRNYLRLQAQATLDQRAVRNVVDAVAHPGKLARPDMQAAAHLLAPLHVLARQGDWAHLAQAASAPAFATALAPVLGEDGPLARLCALEAIKHDEQVQRYLSLCAAQGPVAGSAEAQAQGRESARNGYEAEADTWAVFQLVAGALESMDADGTRWFALRSLRMPRGFPGEPGRAKDEWDVALLRQASDASAADLMLLAEVKASASSAISDLPRLLRGLQRLALADADHAFACLDGSVVLSGASLRSLKPPGQHLPEQVIYCCAAPPDTPPFLSAASQSVLLAEPASIAHGRRVLEGDEAPVRDLAVVWQALRQAPHLRATLHQWETLRIVRAAMVMPQDLQIGTT